MKSDLHDVLGSVTAGGTQLAPGFVWGLPRSPACLQSAAAAMLTSSNARPAVAAVSLLLTALLVAQPPSACAVDIGGVTDAAQAVKGVFGGGDSESNGGSGGGSQGGSPASFGPFVVKTTRAAAALAGLGSSNATAHTLPLADSANVTLIKDRPHSLVVAFEASPSLLAGGPTDAVPFLDSFAATAEAPAALLEAFMQAVEGPGTQGALADVSRRARAVGG